MSTFPDEKGAAATHGFTRIVRNHQDLRVGSLVAVGVYLGPNLLHLTLTLLSIQVSTLGEDDDDEEGRRKKEDGWKEGRKEGRRQAGRKEGRREGWGDGRRERKDKGKEGGAVGVGSGGRASSTHQWLM